MGYHVPKTALSLMAAVYRKIFPAVDRELYFWKKRAEAIPNDELRRQALSSIKSKRFHCQGGAVYALLAGYRWREAIRFIVAYQTISDYLDNLCDRSTSLNPDDFRLLHQSMVDALTPTNPIQHYYALRAEQDDGGYLADLVRTCQSVLRKLDQYSLIQKHIHPLEKLYEDLQVHKHVTESERVERLKNWFGSEGEPYPSLSWYEFSAAAGSTLGIFCLVSYTIGGKMSASLAKRIHTSYFPYMQGLHILLDYYIDQDEDIVEGDLNFCSYYPDRKTMIERFLFFIDQADRSIRPLPDQNFHKMIHHGLVGLYLGDPKVKTLAGGSEIAKKLLEYSGPRARFFHWNTKIYHKLRKYNRNS
ncbi:MAG TPA: tetraprenyl-beta-curcumene synthase family protein [Bacillota bacterium]|nr:tetraprenyl-beta-curcumene synthase family protein [Bacillota bacterium]